MVENNEKLLTVVIPYYNRENTILETIESIENQTRNDFDILVVDDGSKDNAEKIINEFNKKYNNIKYVYKENGGVSSARNLGIKLSKTKYISFLDSDDLYDKEFVEVMLDDISQKDKDLSFCSYYYYNGENTNKSISSFSDKNIVAEYLKGNNSTNMNCFVFSRKYLTENDLRFDESISWGEDMYFLLKCMKLTNNISVVNKHLTYYRICGQGDNLSDYNSDSLSKDKLFVNKILKDPEIKLDSKEEKALLNYRLPALLTYGLLRLYSDNYPKEKIKKLYNFYKEDINKFKLTFDLRSIKLMINIVRLKAKIIIK